MENFTTPNDPCLFDDFNISHLFDQVYINENQVPLVAQLMPYIPCQGWMDKKIFNTFIQPYGYEYLIDYDYWFGDDGQRDPNNIGNNGYQIVVMPCDKNCSYRYDDGNGIFT